MNKMHLKFILNYSDAVEPRHDTPACIDELSREIKLNLPRIMEMAKEEQMTFDDCFAMCISHELIHQILFDVEGDPTSEKFDNICYIKYKKIKHWIGGVGGKK